MSYRTLDDLDVAGKRVLLRVDLNVPIKDGAVGDKTRIERILPSLRELLDKGAAIVLLAHFDRPKGKVVPEMSLRPVASVLQSLLGRAVAFVETDWQDGKAEQAAGAAKPGDVLLMENTRFHPGEEKNSPDFAAELAKLGDLYVNDAFSAAHRAHASTEGVAHLLPAAAGRAMQEELKALERALEQPDRPVFAIVGGAKVSSKLDLLGNLVEKVQALVIGGGMANTFLAAQGRPIGKSLAEREMLETAEGILVKARQAGCDILLPLDAVVAKEFKANAPSRVVALDAVAEDDMILDIGPATAEDLASRLAQARTVVWNGPLGAFEIAPFDRGTVAVAMAVAELTTSGRLASIAGGGDTVAALNHAGVADRFTYVSTAGGAFLEWLEGKALPGVEALRA